jgi:endonuclease G
VTRLDIVGRTASDPALPVGFQDQLFANAFDANGTAVATSITWGTTTPSLVAVDGNGVVTALADGAGVVTATADVNGFTRSWSVPTIVATAGTASYANHLEFGAPTDATPADEFRVTRPQYVASYNAQRGTPNWVAYDLEASHIGALDRCDCFTPDPLWPSTFPQILTSDYTNSGYSRGHLVKSADRTAGTLDNAVTFYFSNIIPQTAANNGGPWLELENHLSNLARDANKEIYVYAGPTGSLGTLKNEGKVTIPSSVWKVAVIMDRDRGLAHVDDPSDFELIAINVPNTATVPGTWPAYRVSVDQLEALTGYDFLSALPDWIETIVEAQVAVQNVELDVQPSNISLSATPVVSVVLLSRAGFDATAVDAAATRLVVNGGPPVAPARRGTAVQTAVADANGDGRPDRLISFAMADLRAAGLAGPPADLVLRLATSPSAWEARDASLPAIVP